MRKVKEWASDNPDAMPPPSVMLRLLRKQGERCAHCTRPLKPGNIQREHVKPIWEGGRNRESNIELWCINPCALDKNGEENTRRADADRAAAKHWGFKAPSKKKRSRPVPGSRASPWKKKVDGTVVRR